MYMIYQAHTSLVIATFKLKQQIDKLWVEYHQQGETIQVKLNKKAYKMPMSNMIYKEHGNHKNPKILSLVKYSNWYYKLTCMSKILVKNWLDMSMEIMWINL